MNDTVNSEVCPMRGRAASTSGSETGDAEDAESVQEPRQYRVRVCLQRFFSDERARCFVWVSGSQRVRWLTRRLRRLFALPPALALVSRGHLLPPSEPLAVLAPDDPVEVIQMLKTLHPEDKSDTNEAEWSCGDELDSRSLPTSAIRKRPYPREDACDAPDPWIALDASDAPDVSDALDAPDVNELAEMKMRALRLLDDVSRAAPAEAAGGARARRRRVRRRPPRAPPAPAPARAPPPRAPAAPAPAPAPGSPGAAPRVCRNEGAASRSPRAVPTL